jgi:L-arabinose isomerase
VNSPENSATVWFVVGSQHLYGDEALRQVRQNAEAVVDGLNQSGRLAVPLVLQPLMTTADDIAQLLSEANRDPHCLGLVFWMHTFSPAKMWIRGLKSLRKPFLHLHTQFHRDLPWETINMDFMNLHQAAHGDREFGFVCTRLGLPRKVVVGHWSDEAVQARIDAWLRAARAWAAWQGARFCRFGDNMRNVAVTEGNKVAAEEAFGFSVNGFGMGDLGEYLRAVEDTAVTALCEVYETAYNVRPELCRGGERHDSLREEARVELGLRAFLKQGGFAGFTDTFEDLHGLRQLPGLAVQRLMADGFGFGAEGDWKTAALLQAMKLMGKGLPGGTSFMEDYTYHLFPGSHLVLGAHMLEICPSIAAAKPSLEIHPLGIGGKEDPVRLVFDAPAGPALNASLVELDDHFRLIVNEVDVVNPPRNLPRLPVARALWSCRPDFKTACAAWIQAGGAHHTSFSYAVSTEMLEDFARMAHLEIVVIDAESRLRDFQ